jgi:hypothetical protein
MKKNFNYKTFHKSKEQKEQERFPKVGGEFHEMGKRAWEKERKKMKTFNWKTEKGKIFLKKL